MEICKGQGECIVSNHMDGYKMFCTNNCIPRNCLNFLVCNSNQANSIMVLGSELCFSCDVTFVKPLVFLKDKKCQLCFTDSAIAIKRFECEHSLCLACFKKAHYGDPPAKPEFPYEKEVEFDYLENQWDIKWIDDPLIIKYNTDYHSWVEKLHANFNKCDYMRECKECK